MSTPEAAPYESQPLTRPQGELLHAQVTALGTLALSPAMQNTGLYLPSARLHQLQQQGMAPRNIVIWPSPYKENCVCAYVGNPEAGTDKPYFFLTTEQADGHDVTGVALGNYINPTSLFISTRVKDASPGGIPIASAAQHFSQAASKAMERLDVANSADDMQIVGISPKSMESMILHINSFALGLADARTEAPFRHDLLNPTYRMANAVFGHMLQRAGDNRTYDPPINEFTIAATPAGVTARGVIIASEKGFVSLHQPSLREPTIVLTDVPVPTDSYGPVMATQHRIQPGGTAVDVHTFLAENCSIARIPELLPYYDRASIQHPLELSSEEVGVKAAHNILVALLQQYGTNAPV